MKANKKEGWLPKWKQKMSKDWRHPKLEVDSKLTNKRRHQLRKQARLDARRALREAKQ